MVKIAHYKEIIASEELQRGIIKDEMAELKEKYGDERRTDITYAEDEIKIEDLIANEEMVVTISSLGYIKRTKTSEYRQQSRGGKGSKGSKTRDKDFVEHMFVVNNHDYLLLFTEMGRCFWIRGYEIPEGSKTGTGRVMQNLIRMPKEDKVKAYIRIEDLTDEDIYKLNRGGHDPYKVYAAYHKAVNSKGAPTVILALTTKGYGTGSREADNTTHQVKKLTLDNIKSFRDKFDIPVSDDDIEQLPYVRPAKDSPEIQYLLKTREGLGGPIPRRRQHVKKLTMPDANIFEKYVTGSDGKKVSSTMSFVRMMTDVIKDKKIGQHIVPIVPDEARTFGMEGLFRQIGIYSSEGQKYKPEDADQVMWYKESKDGVMLEEGINESGAFSAWIALATAYSNYDLPMVPIYLFYSMFGFQRIHDLAWAAGDSQAKGFLIGATSGRTTLNGEGLQHQDGHSHLFSATIPNCLSYDPAYAYELAVIFQHGIQKMFVELENYYYYITVTNENYEQPAKPEGSDEGIIKGMYRLIENKEHQVILLGSGSILNESVKAVEILSSVGIAAEVWSVTSFNMLRKDGIDKQRFNELNPDLLSKVSYVEECLSNESIPVIASTDYMRAYPEQIRSYIKAPFYTLGTDGYGRSDSREKLREFFEIDANNIARMASYALFKRGAMTKTEINKIYKKFKVNPAKPNPWEV